ncbi:hypothetical protein BpHYR1_024459 [Brachionus plicatilis]|uniref:Uncharacterized protein n=1 Tax=Brachionus plicatilis TaxID=10195 RepID=A0A3M7PZD3_BRAPC|nr:hypothetical protein BpHYR1_024459 [Brachionus plicatilis]
MKIVKIIKNDFKIYRGCSNFFLPDNSSLFVDQNGIIYKYCYFDLCNINYEDEESLKIESSTISTSSIIPSSNTACLLNYDEEIGKIKKSHIE